MINKDIVLNAYKGQYCVPGFNIESFDVLDAILRAAALIKSPVIIQTTKTGIDYIGTNEIYYIFKMLVEKNEAEAMLHYDHGHGFEEISVAILKGYNSVMADLTHLSGNEFMKELERIDKVCKENSVRLELEVGNIPDKEIDIVYTDLNEIRRINQYFNIDSYAVSVGSVHGCKKKNRRINFQLLELLHNEIEKPLVIHGSSGIVDDDLRILYQYGVTKVNIETELRLIYKSALQKIADTSEIKSRLLIEGIKEEIIDYVKKKYKILGSDNVI